MAIISAILITVMAFQIPAQAAAAEIKTEYISEIKVGMGKTEAEAKEALEKEGYTVLDCNLNQGAEGGLGSRGKKPPISATKAQMTARRLSQTSPL